MKYYFEILDIISFLVAFSGVIISVLLIGTLDFLSKRNKIIIAIFLFAILYLALIELHEIFRNLIDNFK